MLLTSGLGQEREKVTGLAQIATQMTKVTQASDPFSSLNN